MSDKAIAQRCLDVDDATAYASGRLTREELAVVEDHIDGCVTCRKLLSRTAEMMTPVPGEAPASSDDRASLSPEELTPGTAVGRYVIDARVGAGGMGVVYAAHDPELHRKVALKVMRALILPRDRLAEDLLRREAMAMARIAHPNVVGVHDLFIAGGAMFVAMEFIEGRTLRAWLEEPPKSSRSRPSPSKDRKRGRREVLGVLMLAGRGLAAAHAEGVVHRDLKPENILVGRSGRVCVSDFGLSRFAGAGASERIERAGARGEGTPSHSTIAGGTPRYMAPEQVAGETATTRSDQFSFSIVVYEALYGVHPFGKAGRGLARAWQVEPPPPRSDVPSWVRRVLLRGLAESPSDRYPSVEALLADLGKDPTARRRRVVLELVTMATLLAGVGGVLHARRARREICAHSTAKLAGVWDDGRKRAGTAAFEAVGTPFARDAWGFVARALDRYTAGWTQARTDACEAVLARGEPADVERDPRVLCVDDRLEEARAVVSGALDVKNDDQVGRALTAAESIQTVESCARARAVLHARPVTREGFAQRAAIRADLAHATALSYFGKSEEAAALATKAAEAAEREGDDELLAKALRRIAHARNNTRRADWKAEEARLYRAIELADGVGDDETRANAFSQLLFITGVVARTATLAESRRYFDQGMSAVRRMGGDDALEALLRNALASVLSLQGEDDESRAEFERALEAASRAGYRLLVGEILDNLGQADISRGDLDAAGDHLHRADETLRALVGESHRFVLSVRNDEALLALQRGDAKRARDLARVVADGLAAIGQGESEDASTAFATLAEALLELRDLEPARVAAARSLELREHLGAPPAQLLGPLALAGRALVDLHDPASALGPLDRAVASDKGDPEYRADARVALARALVDLRRDADRARGLANDARVLLDKLQRPTPLQIQKRERVRAWLAANASADGATPASPARP